MPQVDTAIQFLRTVSSSNAVQNRPMSNPSIDDLHLYTLQTQIKDTAKIGRDAGIYITSTPVKFIVNSLLFSFVL